MAVDFPLPYDQKLAYLVKVADDAVKRKRDDQAAFRDSVLLLARVAEAIDATPKGQRTSTLSAGVLTEIMWLVGLLEGRRETDQLNKITPRDLEVHLQDLAVVLRETKDRVFRPFQAALLGYAENRDRKTFVTEAPVYRLEGRRPRRPPEP